MKRTLLCLLSLIVWPAAAWADAAADCKAAAGTLIVGTAQTNPWFKSGKPLKGIPLTHTHLTMQSDADGKSYDVAIDNVFADGYDKSAKTVPAPLNTIAAGDKLSVCGQPFPGGIHWVHTNCGATPTSAKPNGWVRKVTDNVAGENMEGSQKYCCLWTDSKQCP
jgi:hypothetical protein